MKLSKEAEYGLVALKYLASQPTDEILQTSQVADATGLPKPFLARIFVKLVRQNILKSYRGRQRGYQLNRPPADITVRDVLEAIEGLDLFKRCVFWSEQCSDENPCVLHNHWQAHVRPEMIEMMESLTLEKLSKNS